MIYPSKHFDEANDEAKYTDKDFEDGEVRVFEWSPNGHGEYSFVAIDTSKEHAKKRVDAEVEELQANGYSSNCSGWNTDYYSLTVYKLDDVIAFFND